MFVHNFRYSLKLLLKSKSLIFWTLTFPLIMAVLFNMAFSNIENTENFDAIDIAVIQNTDFENNMIFKETLEKLSDSSAEQHIFNITYTDEENAKELLQNQEIAGYLSFVDDDVKLTVKSNGVNQTIIRYVIDEIKTDSSMIMTIGMRKIVSEVIAGNAETMDYEKVFNDIAEKVMSESVNVKDDSSENMSFVMIEYYSLIAMSCLYSSMFSMTLVNYKSANMCSVGKRTSMSPVKKGGLLMGSLAAGYVVQLFGLLMLFLLTIFVIKVDYGNNLPMIILISLLGSLAGLTQGLAVGTLIKKNENTKVVILISITMAGCYLSGMMGISMKNIIDKNIPFLNKINPVAMITDGLYSLYYYPTLDRFYFDVISLIIFSVIMLLISWKELRRQKYDSL